MDDSEFKRHAAALDDVLNRHLGPPPNRPNALDAEYVMMALWLPAAGLGAMNADREREKLTKVQRLARELAETWNSVHFDIIVQMELMSRYIHRTKSGYSSKDPLSLGMVSVLDEIIEMTLPVANDVIDDAPNAGRRALRCVAVVERLREVWSERKSAPAPRSMTDAGPFADFMIEAFEALGLDRNARAAMDSWRAFRDKLPDAE